MKEEEGRKVNSQFIFIFLVLCECLQRTRLTLINNSMCAAENQTLLKQYCTSAFILIDCSADSEFHRLKSVLLHLRFQAFPSLDHC